MSAKQELLDFLFNHPSRTLIDLTIQPGPHITKNDEEELCTQILDALKRTDSGELKPVDSRSIDSAAERSNS